MNDKIISANATIITLSKLTGAYRALTQIPNYCKVPKIVESVRTISNLINSLSVVYQAKQGYLSDLLAIFDAWGRYIDNARALAEDYNTAKNTYYCQVQEEELNTQANEIQGLTEQNKELQAYIIGLEQTIKEQARIIGKQSENQARNNSDRLPTLCPNITPLQVSELWKRLRHIFKGDLKQFARLFDEQITEAAAPMQVETNADTAVFVYFLRKYELISTGKPYAILERIQAFENGGKILTSAQMRKGLEYDKYPYIGKHYNEIEEAIKAVTTL